MGQRYQAPLPNERNRRSNHIALMLYALLAHLPLSQALSQPARIILRPPNLQSTTTNPRLQLECVPLIGGPLWLPLHVQVVVVVDDDNSNPATRKEKKYKFDFIPQQATEPETLLKLVTLQAVPGELRCLSPLSSHTASSRRIVQLASGYTQSYREQSPDLHLLQNNCWTFAWKLIQYLDQEMVKEETQT